MGIGGLAPVSRGGMRSTHGYCKRRKRDTAVYNRNEYGQAEDVGSALWSKGFYYQKLTAAEQDMYYALWQGVKRNLHISELPTSDGELAAKGL